MVPGALTRKARQSEGSNAMADRRKPTTPDEGGAHTELRKQRQVEEAPPQPKPRTPLDRLPDTGDDDDLFNDMPV